jgi:hypothetical protein
VPASRSDELLTCHRTLPEVHLRSGSRSSTVALRYLPGGRRWLALAGDVYREIQRPCGQE